MSLDLNSILGTVGSIFGGGQNPIFDTISKTATIAQNFVPQQTLPAVVTQMQSNVMAATPVRATVPAVRGSSLTQEVFNAGSAVLSRLGIPTPASAGAFTSVLKRALTSVASLARRTPAGTMVSLLTGLGLAAYEANLLTVWHAQRRKGRRMNPSNARALRRAARRIRSFHKLCTVADVLKSRGRRTSVGRCGTCRKSPCRC